MSVKENLTKARFKLTHKFPYLSTAAFALQFRQSSDPDLTFAVDKYWRLYFNPDNLKDFSINEMMGGILHELHHLLRVHHERYYGGMSQAKWNVATDCEINDDLIRDRVVLPEGVIFPEDFGLEDLKIAEKYYAELPDQPDQPSFGGSCSDGVARDYEESAEQDSEAIQEGEASLIRDKTAEDIKQHEKSNGVGSVPGNLSRWAGEFGKSKINWRTKLAAAVRKSMTNVKGNFDYSYRHPARRRLKGIVMPGMTSPVPNVAVVIDTSGSMGDNDINKAMQETDSIIKNSGQRHGVRILSVDSQMHKAQKVFSTGQIELFGGGGTDMRLGIDEAHRLKPRPDICIVITDGFTPWPDHAPAGMRVITCLTNERGQKNVKRSWCDTILVED